MTYKSTSLFKKLFLISLTALLITGMSAFSQKNDTIIPLGEKVSIYSKILNEERNVLVYLPDSYHSNSLKYPVIYILDGGFHFIHASGIVQFLASINCMPEAIIVAVTNVDRNRDFTPTFVEQMPTSGGARKFHEFLNKELIPFMDDNYTTNSYRILIGHSLGGAFAVYSLQEYPETFNSYIAISPFLMFDDNLLVKSAKDKIHDNYKQEKFFYLTLGNEPNYYEAVNEFVATVRNASPHNFSIHYKSMMEETHASIPHLSIYYGLKQNFDGWQLPDEIFQKGLKDIEEYYRDLSKKFDYKIELSENEINTLGYTYLTQNETDKAIEIFQENVKRFPLSANVYDSLGEAYETNGNTEMAIKNYEIAVELGKSSEHPFTNIYQKNLDRASEHQYGK